MSGVNQIWKSLARKVSKYVNTTKTQNSMVYVPNGFFVNMENQEEFYYWDTYWIIRGINFIYTLYLRLSNVVDIYLVIFLANYFQYDCK